MMVDTLTIARELKAADLPEGQAEAIAAAIGRSVSETAATKADVELAKQELRGDIHRLRGDMERLARTLIVWFIGTQVTIGGLIVAIIKL